MQSSDVESSLHNHLANVDELAKKIGVEYSKLHTFMTTLYT